MRWKGTAYFLAHLFTLSDKLEMVRMGRKGADHGESEALADSQSSRRCPLKLAPGQADRSGPLPKDLEKANFEVATCLVSFSHLYYRAVASATHSLISSLYALAHYGFAFGMLRFFQCCLNEDADLG